MSYAALGAECVGMDVISDPITGQCHCPIGMVRLGTLVPDAGDVGNDCVDPGQFSGGGTTTVPEVVIQGTVRRSPMTVAVAVKPPLQMGLYAGWAGILALGGFGVSLIWKATHGGRRS
jgi:hypothetical protein